MIRHRKASLVCLFALVMLGEAVPLPAPAAALAGEGVEFFEKRIRPVLVEHCFKCHSAESEKLKGGLMLDSRERLLRGGETGPAVVPGDAEKSLLVKAVRYTDKELQMPPKEKKLSDRQIADLAAWVKMGVPWPVDDQPKSARTKLGAFEITEKDRAYWAFQPIKRPVLPSVKQKAWPANPIDVFVLAELEARGLAPNPPATKRELARRIYFDLIGLPPTSEQVAAFEKDQAPEAYQKLIDRLLSLPQYGERWARHWLDVVRFAQSNGYEVDSEKSLAWRYRDYVIRSFNQDKPYDRFILEQIAGDELEPPTRDSIIATGFQRLGVWDEEPDDKRMAEFDELDDILSTTSTTFLGLTMGCARCHDHKFDPISQTDYYQMLSFFRNLRLNEKPNYEFNSANYAPISEPQKIKLWQEGQQAKVKALEEQLAAAKSEADKGKIQKQFTDLKSDTGPIEWALAAKDRGAKPLPTHVLIRGNAASPGPEVQPAFLSVLGGQRPALAPRAPEAQSTGRRLALAEWMASPQNPLPARVLVNRIWQYHFGRGIVESTTDFGHAGIPATHPELLDWLAAEFIESGWSIKRIHQAILLSNTYRMSSRVQNAKAVASDPGNRWFWRQNLRRLDAETIRDSVLSISGNLNPSMGGRGFFPHLGAEVLAGQSRPGLYWEISSRAEQSRRSIYTYIRRTMLVPMLDTFDYSNTTSPLGERPVTTVAPQALMLLNDEFMKRQAASFADRLMLEAGGNPGKQIRRGYQLALARSPTKHELQIALDFLRRQTAALRGIRSRLSFRPDVPNSLSVEYMKQLEAPDFLIGPRTNWNYQRGRWSGAYEGIRTMERWRGPFALWTGERFEDGAIEAGVVLHTAAEFGSVLLRATVEGDEQRGYEVTLDPRQQRVILRRHSKELAILAEADAAIPTGRTIPLKIELAGSRIRVWLNGGREPIMEATDANPVKGDGFLGVRTWGAGLSVDGLTLLAHGKKIEVARGQAASNPSVMTQHHGADGPGNDEQREGLQAFCLMLFNLNELIYAD